MFIHYVVLLLYLTNNSHFATIVATKQKGAGMGYRIIADKFETDMMRQKYGPRKGLEGPFKYASGRVLYYDPKEGRYYDPTTDFYVSHEEMDAEHGILVKRLVDFQR